jgi:hypothetical protein
MRLTHAQAAAIRAAKLRAEQAAWPEYDISVAVRMTLNADGSTEVVVTRSRKSS